MAEDRRITKTKKAIKKAFVELLLETRSMNSISVTKLVEAADISRGTFYLHYTDLYMLLGEVENDLIEDFKETINKQEPEILEDFFQPLVREIISFIEKHNEILHILVADRLDMSFTDKLKLIAREKCFENWSKIYGTEPNKNYDYYYSFIFAGTMFLIISWFEGKIDETAESMARLIDRVIIDGAKILS